MAAIAAFATAARRAPITLGAATRALFSTAAAKRAPVAAKLVHLSVDRGGADDLTVVIFSDAIGSGVTPAAAPPAAVLKIPDLAYSSVLPGAIDPFAKPESDDEVVVLAWGESEGEEEVELLLEMASGEAAVEVWSESEDDQEEEAALVKNKIPNLSGAIKEVAGGEEEEMVPVGSGEEDEEAFYYYFEMPGLGKEDVKVAVEKGGVVIEGGPGGKLYSCRVDLEPEACKVNQITSEMKNGVLKIVVPKVKLEERTDVVRIAVE